MTALVRRMLALRHTLLGSIVGSFLLLSLATVLVVAGISFSLSRSALRDSVYARLEAAAAAREGELTRWVEVQRDELVLLASLDFPRAAHVAGRYDTLSVFLTRVQKQRPDFRNLFVVSADGRVVAGTSAAHVGEFRVNDRYFREGRHHTFVQNVHPSPVTGLPTLTVSTPLSRDDGSVAAVLVADLNLARLDRVLSEGAALGASGEIYLVDRYHGFVTGLSFERGPGARGAHSPAIEAALAGRSGAASYANYADVPVVGAYRWMPQLELALVSEMAQEEAFAPARDLATTTVLVGIVCALVLGLVVLLLGRGIVRPVLALTSAAARVADGDLHATAPVTSRDEVGTLTGVFNAMTERLVELYASLEEEVTERQLAAEALANSKHLLQAIVDSSTAVISVRGLEGGYALVNGAFARLAAREREDVLGRSDREIFPPEIAQRRQANAERVRETGAPTEEEVVVARDGEPRTFLALTFPLVDAHGATTAVCEIATDITDRKQSEAERLRVESQLLESQKLESLGTMAGGIAHDFNNLLAVIIGNTDLARMDLPQQSPASEALEEVGAAAQRAADLTAQMLAYSGKGRIDAEPVRIGTLVAHMAQLLSVTVSKKVDLRFQLPETVPAIDGDRGQLRQVLVSLVTNAAEAVGDAPGVVTISTGTLQVEDGRLPGPDPGKTLVGGAYVFLEVSDTGIGMDKETQARIFEPFFTTKFTGRGLGLATVHGIVRAHGGAVQMHSAPGQGTTVRVLFPASAATLPVRAVAAATPRPAGSGGTVLVVDDEPALRTCALRVLQRYGYRVLTAGDGVEGVELFREHAAEIDVVLLDATMPRMGGIEAMQSMHAIREDACVILSSGFSEDEEPIRRAASRFTSFLQKPYTPQSLLAEVMAALAGRAPREAAASSSPSPVRLEPFGG
jgi:PAS domain S-box-containing protein